MPPDQHSGAGDIDLNKILLPKKEISTDSAQRADAGTLVAQEQSATLLVPKTETPPTAPPPAPVPADDAGVRKIETYQGDIESVIQNKDVSVVSIAAAEADRRGGKALESDAPKTPFITTRTLLFAAGGFVLLLCAGGLLWYVFSAHAPLPAQTLSKATFLTTDGTQVVTLADNQSASSAMQALVDAKKSIRLSLGLVGQLYVQRAATSSASAPAYIDAQALLSLLAPDIPQTLVRDIQPVYVLGVHSFGVNQPFLIVKVDSYEQAYAGMLAWEATMVQDLSPLFAYTPPPVINPQVQPDASTTAQTQLLQTGFIDKVVQNHDARVRENADGSIYFLWTFLDRQTLAITTNKDTLREILIRLTDAPITALPPH